MVPAISYGRFIALDNLKQNNSCQLRSAISTEANGSLTDHYTLLVGLHFRVK
jgi:hypothetical protein